MNENMIVAILTVLDHEYRAEGNQHISFSPKDNAFHVDAYTNPGGSSCGCRRGVTSRTIVSARHVVAVTVAPQGDRDYIVEENK